MNAIAVVPKSVVVMPARTAEVSSVSWRAADDPFARRLRVMTSSGVAFDVEGVEYDALGQWTDDTVKGLILSRLGLVEAA